MLKANEATHRSIGFALPVASAKPRSAPCEENRNNGTARRPTARLRPKSKVNPILLQARWRNTAFGLWAS
jgi:hypothetical protein